MSGSGYVALVFILWAVITIADCVVTARDK